MEALPENKTMAGDQSRPMSPSSSRSASPGVDSAEKLRGVPRTLATSMSSTTIGVEESLEDRLQEITVFNAEGGDRIVSLRLPEAKYEVLSLRSLGIKKKCTMFLKSDCVEVVTSRRRVYPYKNISRVGLKNTDRFSLTITGRLHQFSSKVSTEIVQEISSRLSSRQSKREKIELNDTNAAKFQENLSKTTDDVDPTVVEQASQEDSRPATAPASSASSRPGPVSNAASETVECANLAGHRDDCSPKPEVDRQDARVRRASKLEQMTGHTEQQRIKSVLDKVINSSSAPEGDTIRQFVRNFRILERSPSSAPSHVRQFIDGMREYIKEARKSELDVMVIMNVNGEGHPLDPVQRALGNEPNVPDVSSIINKMLERAVITPVYHRVYKCISDQCEEADALLAKCMDKLRTRPPEHFGVSQELKDETNWDHAVSELNKVDACTTPTDKLKCILNSARSIYNAYNRQRRKQEAKDGSSAKKSFLGADEFVPIFIYVVVRTKIELPDSLTTFMWALSDPGHLQGEGGFYLTALEAAFQHIRELGEKEGVKVTKEQIKHRNLENVLTEIGFL